MERGSSNPRVVSFFSFRPFQPNPGANRCCASLPILRPTLTPTWKLDFVPYTPSPQPHGFFFSFLFFLFSGCGLKAGGGSSRTFCRDCPSFLFAPFSPSSANRLLYSTAVSFSPASHCRKPFQFPFYTVRISIYSFSCLLSYKYVQETVATVILLVEVYNKIYDKWTYVANDSGRHLENLEIDHKSVTIINQSRACFSNTLKFIVKNIYMQVNNEKMRYVSTEI